MPTVAIAAQDPPSKGLKKRKFSDTESKEVASLVESAVAPFILSLVKELAVAYVRDKENNVIYFANKSDSISAVWTQLCKRNFLSAPVLNLDGSCFGFVSILDIATYVLRNFAPKPKTVEAETTGFWDLVLKSDQFMAKTVNDVISFPSVKNHRFHPVRMGYSAFSCFEALARDHGLHRLAVVDKNRKIVNLVTQSAVANFMFRNKHLLGGFLDMPLTKFSKDIFKEVVTVQEDSKAADAFDTMLNNGISGLAVVNKKRDFVSCLSLRDLKTVKIESYLFPRLQQKVSSFLRHVKEEAESKATGYVGHKQHVFQDATIGDVLELLATRRVHRVFILKSKKDKNVVGICSLQDLMMLTLDHYQKPEVAAVGYS